MDQRRANMLKKIIIKGMEWINLILMIILICVAVGLYLNDATSISWVIPACLASFFFAGSIYSYRYSSLLKQEKAYWEHSMEQTRDIVHGPENKRKSRETERTTYSPTEQDIKIKLDQLKKQMMRDGIPIPTKEEIDNMP